MHVCLVDHFDRDGRSILAGVELEDDHPSVLLDPAMFRRVGQPVVEQATANPGEIRRGPGRPRKDSTI